MSEKIISRKEREREFKKKEILDASIELFAQKGFITTTLDDIAEKSEFGKGTLYNYFASKEEIYKAIIASIIENHRNEMNVLEKETNTFQEYLFETMKRHIGFCLNNKNAFLLMVFTGMHHKKSTTPEISKMMIDNEKLMISHYTDKANAAIRNKEIRDIDSERIIKMFKASSFAYIYDRLISGKLKMENIDDEARFVTDIIFNGINIK